MAAQEPTIHDVMNELYHIRKELAVMVEFVGTLQAVLAEMSSNPMLKAFGIGGLEGLQVPLVDLPMLPGMPER